MASVPLNTFDFHLPENDDCWHLDAPHEVEIRRRGSAPLVCENATTKAAPHDRRQREGELVDTYKRVGINARVVQGPKGKGVKVVIFDNGVDIQHPSLKPNVSFVDAQDFDHDDQGRSHGEGGVINNRFNAHGTACAGIVAAAALRGVRVVGVAPEAMLVPIRISTNFETQSLVNALEYARGVGDVILIPRYLPESPELSARISAIAGEVPIVCASGNDGTDFLVHPASLKGTIAVGACNEKGYRATYSQYGAGLDVVAPSNDLAVEDDSVVRLDLDEANFRVRAEEELQARLANRPPPPSQLLDLRQLLARPETKDWNVDRFGPLSVATTDNTGDFGYNDEPAGDFCPATGDVGFGGTSAAAAQVAGVVALMLSACLEKHDREHVREHLTPEKIQNILKDTAYKSKPDKTYLHPELGPRKFEAEFGAGLVNAAAAVDEALKAC